MRLDIEEKELLDDFENNKLRSIDIDKDYLSEVATNTLKQKKMINFRVNERDYRSLKVKASELGIPYQTLLKMIIHQFSEGKIKISV